MTYNEFIQQIVNTRGKWNIPDGAYYEAHHIIPICMGGTGRKRHDIKDDNVIWLYPREHFIAHQLLVKEYPDNEKLQYALWCMATGLTNNKDLYSITPEEYEELKVNYSNMMRNKYKSTNHWTEESANKYRASRAYKKANGMGVYQLKNGRPTGLRASNVKPLRCIETGELFISGKDAAEKGYPTAGKSAKYGTSSQGLHFEYVDKEVLLNG